MDKRYVIIAALSLLAVLLTWVRETRTGGSEMFSLLPSLKQEISGERVSAMADTTLRRMGIAKNSIRPVRNRNDVRVLMPPAFDPVEFVKVMRDSLEGYEAEVISSENAKEKSSIVQIKNGELILRSYLFTKEPVVLPKKGVTSSAPKKQTR